MTFLAKFGAFHVSKLGVQVSKERLGSADTGYGTGKVEEEPGEEEQGGRDTPGRGRDVGDAPPSGSGGGRVRDAPGCDGGAQRTEL